MAYLSDTVLVHAAGAHGICTRRQLLREGHSRHEVDGWLKQGCLVGVHTGVYRVAGAPVTLRSHVMAAVRRSHGIAAAETTLALTGVEGFAPKGKPRVAVRAASAVGARRSPSGISMSPRQTGRATKAFPA